MPCLILPIGPVVRKYDVIHKTGSTQRIATASQEDRVTATGKTQKNGEVRQRGFRVVRADRQTDRQTQKQTYSSQDFATLLERSNNVYNTEAEK